MLLIRYWDKNFLNIVYLLVGTLSCILILQVHWLPLELLLTENPSPSQCTFKGDVWALATTYWQIFSFGIKPLMGVDPKLVVAVLYSFSIFTCNFSHFSRHARDQYICGDRLDRPQLLKKSQLYPIYEIMQQCWNPNSDLRMEPQAIMRDMNQLLYRVFNSKRVMHNYVSIDDDYMEGGSVSTTYNNGFSDSQSSTETIVSNISSVVKQTNEQVNNLLSPNIVYSRVFYYLLDLSENASFNFNVSTGIFDFH